MRKQLCLYIKDDRAFVDLGAGYLLCIGSKDAVDHANDRQICEMVIEAIAINKFMGLPDTATIH